MPDVTPFSAQLAAEAEVRREFLERSPPAKLAVQAIVDEVRSGEETASADAAQQQNLDSEVVQEQEQEQEKHKDVLILKKTRAQYARNPKDSEGWHVRQQSHVLFYTARTLNSTAQSRATRFRCGQSA